MFFPFFQVPVFPGESDIDQLVKIYSVLGTPTVNDWAVSGMKIEMQDCLFLYITL